MKCCDRVFHLRNGVGVTVVNVVPGDVTAVFGLEVAGLSEDTHIQIEGIILSLTKSGNGWTLNNVYILITLTTKYCSMYQWLRNHQLHSTEKVSMMYMKWLFKFKVLAINIYHEKTQDFFHWFIFALNVIIIVFRKFFTTSYLFWRWPFFF